MADETNKEILEEIGEDVTERTQTEGITEGTQTEGTTGNGYLTKPYLVRNLQTFWGKIKQYITNQKFVNEDTVRGALLSKADQSDLDSLEDIVGGKADKSALEALETNVASKIDKNTLDTALATKVNVDGDKVLSDNNFTDVFRDKLNNLPASVVTHADMGFMSGDDKQKLDELVEKAVTEVDEALSETSRNPVQNKIINEALNGKVDKENLIDSSNLINSGLSCEGNSDGDIILTLHQSTKHFKIHTESGETIEKFYVSFKDTDGQEVNFNGFGEDNRIITIPNPDGEGNSERDKVYNFYVENYETLTNENYEPFILKIKRGSTDPTELNPSIFKNQ